jgi:Right handed beta helix region
MTKIAVLLAIIVTALASMPAQAQRVFVSASGVDTNPCSVDLPCRTWQQAFNIAPANSVIYVLDPATYGPLTITHGITIQAHGVGAVVQTAGSPNAAITVAVTTSDPVTLNGLLLDGGGTGFAGIRITSGASVQILNSVVRHFQFGIAQGSSTNGSNLLIEDTVASDNTNTGIAVGPTGLNPTATLNRITANNNLKGVAVGGTNMTIANSVISNNAGEGLFSSAFTYLAKNVISGNNIGVGITGGTVFSYGDNYIRDNPTPVFGGLTPVTTQ